eukprot:5784964-Prymnesium_polylepis.1
MVNSAELCKIDLATLNLIERAIGTAMSDVIDIAAVMGSNSAETNTDSMSNPSMVLRRMATSLLNRSNELHMVEGGSADTRAEANAETKANADAKEGFPSSVRHSQIHSISDQWTAEAWLASSGVASAIAKALLPDAGDGLSELKRICGLAGSLKSEAQFTHQLRTAGVAEKLATHIFPRLRELAAGGSVIKSDDLQSKFAGAIELSYGGMETYFEGLEGQVGAPDRNISQTMEAEHTLFHDSRKFFITGNYG